MNEFNIEDMETEEKDYIHEENPDKEDVSVQADNSGEEDVLE